LKLTPEQKKQLAEIQKDVDGKLDKLLTDQQKVAMKQMQPNAVAGGPGGSPPGGQPLFRAYRFGVNHAAFAGRKLTPGKTIEELQQATEKKAVVSR
jgi:hypothetical protein